MEMNLIDLKYFQFWKFDMKIIPFFCKPTGSMSFFRILSVIELATSLCLAETARFYSCHILTCIWTI